MVDVLGPDVCRYIYGLKNTNILLVDGDNFPEIGKILVRETETKVPTNLQCFSFIAHGANFKHMNHLKDTFPTWFRLSRARTDSKDAADANISFAAGVLASNTHLYNPITLLTRDVKFANELLAAIQNHSSGRPTRLLDVNKIELYLQELDWVPANNPIPDHLKSPRDTERRLSEELQTTPRLKKQLPPSDFICKFCGTRGDSPNAHWVNQCPTKPATPVSKPKTGYRCNICGQLGGQENSHWRDMCPQIKRREPSPGKKRVLPPDYEYHDFQRSRSSSESSPPDYVEEYKHNKPNNHSKHSSEDESPHK
jgi:hypothetical protein